MTTAEALRLPLSFFAPCQRLNFCPCGLFAFRGVFIPPTTRNPNSARRMAREKAHRTRVTPHRPRTALFLRPSCAFQPCARLTTPPTTESAPQQEKTRPTAGRRAHQRSAKARPFALRRPSQTADTPTCPRKKSPHGSRLKSAEEL